LHAIPGGPLKAALFFDFRLKTKNYKKERQMNKMIKAALLIASLSAVAFNLFAGETAGSFSQYVDSKGNMSLPADFRATWIHLGTWLVTSRMPAGSGLDETAPGSGFHGAYTQPESLRAYMKDGRWPDGAMLVMEIRAINWDDLPTGHVMVEGEPVKRLVMVKDSKGRFPKNPNWGDGWGWAVFTPGNPRINSSTDYKNDCLGCHESAKATDLVFIQGYPLLRME
jgi:hypothetical protein